jgi:RNA polymerase sigma factor (TIGR02999 family)
MAALANADLARGQKVTAPLRKGEITELLHIWSSGDPDALTRLMPLVYKQLRQIAKQHLKRERTGHTLETTAVIHEAYLKLIDQRSATWKNRNQFFAVAAQVMRRVLVDYGRSRRTSRRGGRELKVSLSEALGLRTQRDLDIVALSEALDRLAVLDPRKARVVELRYFGGLTIEEAAEVLGLSPATVKTEWAMAKAWLFQTLVEDH